MLYWDITYQGEEVNMITGKDLMFCCRPNGNRARLLPTDEKPQTGVISCLDRKMSWN